MQNNYAESCLSGTLGGLKPRESEATSAESIAGRAATLVGGPRSTQHGDTEANHANIAYVWNGILRAAGKHGLAPLDAHDVANLMEGLKIARRYCGKFNLDDYVDGAGYAAVAGEIAAKRSNNGG